MASIRQVYENIKNANFTEVVVLSLNQDKETFVNEQQAQMYIGQTNRGNKIQPQYGFEDYAIEKHELNPLAGKGTPDLFLTGAFYEGIDMEIEADGGIGFNSSDWKNGMLKEKYDDIFGLNKESRERVIEKSFRGKLINNYKKATKLG